MFAVYGEKFCDEGTSLRLAEVAFERYLTLGADLHGIPSLATQCHIVCDDVCEESRPEILGGEVVLDVEGLVAIKDLERTGVRKTLREEQNICRVEGWKVPSFVIEVIEFAVPVETVRKDKAAPGRSTAQMIRDMGRLRIKLVKATLSVQVTEMMRMVLKAQVGNL